LNFDKLKNNPARGYVIYLAGDSYTTGDGIENSFAKHLADSIGFDFISQRSLMDSYPDAKVQTGKFFLERVEGLKRLINTLSSPVILLGRSSGARVATLCAEDKRVLAGICFAYPFKHPKRPAEEGRYLHLENISKPILIIQGVRDEYGGLVGVQRYTLSKFINFHYLNANHGSSMNAKTQNIVRMRIKRFLIESGILGSVY
jgi:predicted alpha/beta-hydrolase family hydrolase